jgi:ABC-type protease/lipase transport system fused ATPase/permease subunit
VFYKNSIQLVKGECEMRNTMVTICTTVLIVLFCLIVLPLIFGYKIAYYTDVKYDFEAIGAIGQWIGAVIPILLVFLSAYVTRKFDEGKKEVASSNIATVEYIRSIEKDLIEKIEKMSMNSQYTKPVEKTAEEIREKNKEKAYKFVSISMFAKTAAVANHLGVSKEEAFEILQELLHVDGLITCGGSSRRENMDNVIWLKKSR